MYSKKTNALIFLISDVGGLIAGSAEMKFLETCMRCAVFLVSDNFEASYNRLRRK
jgi:hypothetical protein